MMELSISIHVDDEIENSADVGHNPAEGDKKHKKKSVLSFGSTKTGNNKKSTPASHEGTPTPASTSHGATIKLPVINTNGMTSAQLKRKIRDDHQTKAKANNPIANLELQLGEMKRTLLGKDKNMKTFSQEKQDDKKAVNNVNTLFISISKQYAESNDALSNPCRYLSISWTEVP